MLLVPSSFSLKLFSLQKLNNVLPKHKIFAVRIKLNPSPIWEITSSEKIQPELCIRVRSERSKHKRIKRLANES
jgi:hypothetical protein